MISLKSIWKVSCKALFIAGLCLVATNVAEAKTVTTSNSFIDQNAYTYFNDVYSRENYKYGVMTYEYYQNVSSYNYTPYYYLCLTNEEIDVSNSTNVTSSCEKLLRYSRENNTYTAETLNDNELKVSNTLYYYFDNKEYYVHSYLFIIAILSVISCLFTIFILIFKG